jgi:hypothetical protein
MPTRKIQQQTGHQRFDWPLTGRLRKDVDPMLIGETNFRDLVNMRYTIDGIKGIQGMTKINASALAYLSTVNGFHFKKDLPAESHVFVQANSGASSALYKSNNTTTIPNQDTFSSFQTLENNNTLFFSDAPNGAVVASNGAANRIWAGKEDRCGQFVVFDPAGTFWYDYTDQVNNTLSDAKNIATLHQVGGACNIYIASSRPLQGVKFYVKTANATAAVATAYEWTGAAWSSLTITDGTILIAGKTLSQTGEITFASTVTTSKSQVLNNTLAYYYKFVFTSIDAGTTIYYCTIDAPMQPITDIWDGNGRTCLSCFQYITAPSFYDWTTNVAPSTPSNPKPYVAGYQPSYANFGSLAPTYYVYFGFADRQTAIQFSMPDSSYVNTSPTVADMSYWNGVAWTAVTAFNDSTSNNGISLSNSGTMSWIAPDENTEFKTTVANGDEFYYYRLHVSNITSGSVFVNNVAGITTQKNIRPYRFSALWQNRLWLFNDQSDRQNSCICSAYNTNSVFNGDDSVDKEFGNGEAVICAESIFSRYGNSIYDNLIVLKQSSAYLIDGIGPSTWTFYTVSSKVGCVAPLTLKRCDMNFEVSAGNFRQGLIWRSARGIEFFDGNTLVSISNDINNFFDPSSTDYINPTTYTVSAESASYDETNFEYHWYFTNVSGKQEWVFSLRYRKWFQVNRGTGKSLTCGFTVRDSNGSVYMYGGTADGYLERTEYGTTLDGNSIYYMFYSGDILLAKTAAYFTKLRHLKLLSKSKNTSTATVAVTVFLDTATTGISQTVISQANSLKRVYQIKSSINLDAVMFGIKYEVTTSNETIGFEPYVVSGLWEVIREDV